MFPGRLEKLDIRIILIYCNCAVIIINLCFFFQLSDAELPPFHFHPPSGGFDSYPSSEVGGKLQGHLSSFSFAPPQPLGGFSHYPSLYTQDITSKELGTSHYKNFLCDSLTSDAFPSYAMVRDSLKDQVTNFNVISTRV